MAFSTDNIGKNCYINISEDQNIENSLYGTIIGYYSDNNEEYYFISINGNVEKIYDDSLVNIIEDSGSGSVTPSSIVAATGQMTDAQAAQTRDNINAAHAETVQTVSGTDPTITPAINTLYNCGELTSLTIDSPPATGAWSVVFTSGSTATTTTIPSTILGLEDFAADTNTMYEINVLDNRAVVGSWEVASA